MTLLATDDKKKQELMIDKMQRPLTQGLFLEIGYGPFAIFTLDDYDKEYKGKTYPSLKKVFLEEGDLGEYHFAKKYLLGWKHWQRMNENSLLRKHFDEWRDELEIKIRSEAIRSIVEDMNDNFQAVKWLAEKGWDKKSPGRPKKHDQEKEDGIMRRINEEFEADVIRLNTNR